MNTMYTSPAEGDGRPAITPLRVLIVEDNANDAELLRLELRKGGFAVTSRRVETAADMGAALASEPWDIVISDYAMPTFDGLSACLLLQRTGLDLPFIIVSGTVGEDVAVEAMRAGAHDYLLKDNLTRLCAAVRRELTEVASRRARRLAEESLAKSESRRKAFFAASPDQVFVVGRDGTILDYVPAVGVETSFAQEEVLGRTLADVFPPKPAGLSMRAVAKALATGQVQSLECALKDRDRKVHWWESRVTTCSEDEVVIVARDVTERRNAERQLRSAQRLEAIGQLAGGIAHDFNNLLNVIDGCSTLLLRLIEADQEAREYIEEIRNTVRRAAKLMRQLLTFSRNEAQKLEVLDLSEIAASAESMLRWLIRSNIKMVSNLADGLGMVECDLGQVEQILVNLVVNARDAMKDGGTITLETANVELDGDSATQRAAYEPGRYVMLSVADTGCGMDAETQSHIFEPFFTTKGPDEGTGLGLSTVYGIVKQHRGHITVHSEIGHGTTFKLYLPRADAPATKSPGDTVAPEPGGAETILLVDNQDMVRAAARGSLASAGYQVIEASSGADALERCNRHQGPLHLVVTDLAMPTMSGRELVDRLTRLRPGISILYMSGHTGVLDDDGSGEKAPLLQKPFARSELLRAVRAALAQGEASQTEEGL